MNCKPYHSGQNTTDYACPLYNLDFEGYDNEKIKTTTPRKIVKYFAGIVTTSAVNALSIVIIGLGGNQMGNARSNLVMQDMNRTMDTSQVIWIVRIGRNSRKIL